MRNRAALSAAVIVAAATVALALTGCGGGAGSNIPNPTALPTETTSTSVFYSTGRTLVEEPKVVDANNIYVGTLNELLKAQPELNTEIAIVQPATKVLSVTLKDGVATVDFSKDVLVFDATDKEKTLAWASILETMGQFPEVKQVQFSVEGKTTGTVGGKDVQAFWGKISLKGQPWPAPRPPGHEPASETTGSAETSGAKK